MNIGLNICRFFGGNQTCKAASLHAKYRCKNVHVLNLFIFSCCNAYNTHQEKNMRRSRGKIAVLLHYNSFGCYIRCQNIHMQSCVGTTMGLFECLRLAACLWQRASCPANAQRGLRVTLRGNNHVLDAVRAAAAAAATAIQPLNPFPQRRSAACFKSARMKCNPIPLPL